MVVVGDDAARVGAVARAIEDAGGRAAVFVGEPAREPDRAALVEMVAELFPED